MKASAEVAFELKTVLLPVASIATKTDVTQEIRKSKKYRQIAASIEHVGLIEPLIVSRLTDGTYLLLDGALRLDILKQRRNEQVRCILSTDDEGYTYNKRVSHLSNIGEHYMILKALANGVSEQMISASLNVDVETIRRKRSLLDGICPEAVQLLSNRRVSMHAYGFLRKMIPLGQIQAAERMIHANNYSATMAKTLLTITKPDLMVSPAKIIRSSPSRCCFIESGTPHRGPSLSLWLRNEHPKFEQSSRKASLPTCASLWQMRIAYFFVVEENYLHAAKMKGNRVR